VKKKKKKKQEGQGGRKVKEGSERRGRKTGCLEGEN
jgi:hypothetical protein